MAPVSIKGQKQTLVALSVAYPILIALVTWRLAAGDTLRPRPGLEPRLLPPLVALLAIIALVNITHPWLRYPDWERETRLLPAGRVPELRTLLLGLPFAAAPASYGLLLYFLDAPLGIILTFAAASLLAAAAWGWAALRQADDA